MKTTVLVLLLTGVLFSCTKKDSENSDLTGKWRLIEILADPGDGSGTFHSVTSNKTIEFNSNGTIISNGSICDMSIESGSSSIGTYSLSDSTLKSSNCETSPMKIRFQKKGSYLIIHYPCDEACGAKYVKD